MCIIYVCSDLTYREVEGFASAFPNGTMNHSILGSELKGLKPNPAELVLESLRKDLKRRVEFDSVG